MLSVYKGNMKQEDKNNLDWKIIGSRFKQVREERNYTQEQIGKLSNQLQVCIARFEAGAQPASTHYALFLRNEFCVSFDWLYDGENVIVKNSHNKVEIINPIEIGKRIKNIRNKECMTLKAFGEWIGISYVAVLNIEKGNRTPEIKTALKIKRALNKPLDWIYFGDNCIVTKGSVDMPTTIRYTPLKQLKKELKEEAINYIKKMDTRDLAMLMTRLKAEQKVISAKDCTNNDTQHNTTQH
ncbi:helix-turn-helix domain-containing protein, partial [Candidatus Liberibacter americanus]